MDIIDFEVIRQLIKEKYPDEKEYAEKLKLFYKIYMNSFDTPCASDVFHINDPKLMKEITEKGKEEIDKYKELFGESDECYVTENALDKFNEMLHDGKHTREECYLYLSEEKNKLEYKFYQKHGFYMNMDYNFLYPERISSCALEKIFKK